MAGSARSASVPRTTHTGSAAAGALDANPGAGMQMGDFLFVERIASAVGKGNTALAGEINKALAAILADGTYATISKKWFNEDIRCK